MTGRERLMRLVDILATTNARNFNLGSWDCGTTACAVGHAARDPVLQDEGLIAVNGPIFGHISRSCTIRYKEYTGMSAASSFFGVGYLDANYLFSPLEYRVEDQQRPSVVRRRIEAYLKRTASDSAPDLSDRFRCEYIIERPRGGVCSRRCRRTASVGSRFCSSHPLKEKTC
jgi:hypothetical protein